jgi:hypothetical protein
MIENLLKEIKNNRHAFHNLIKVKDDNSIINFEEKEKLIYGNKKVYLEELAREILMQTYLKHEKSIYITEVKHTEECRADLIAKTDEISSIIEVKQVDAIKDYTEKKDNKFNTKRFKHFINDAFSQAKDLYADDLKEADTFISVFIMDVKKIINNPVLLTKYFNLDVQQRSDINNYLIYGIYIETKRYFTKNKHLSDESWFNLAQHGTFYIEKNKILGIDKIFCQINKAIHLPTTSTDSYGIKNVRDIKSPTNSSEKKDLILNILTTSLEAYNKNDPTIITNAGKDKDFLVSKNESIFYKKKISSFLDSSSLTVSTLNGAIIDGQNSIDSFRWIIDTVEKYNKNQELETIEKKIINTILKYKPINLLNHNKEIDIIDYLQFLKKTPLTINIEITEDTDSARKRAKSKNNTMLVTKSELEISEIQIHIQALSSVLLENYEINLNYPKKEIFAAGEKLKQASIDIEKLVKYLYFFNFINKDGKLDAMSLFRYSTSLSGTTKKTYYSVIKDKYVHQSTVDNPEKNKIEEDINNLEKSKKDKEYILSLLTRNNQSNDSEIEEIQKEIDIFEEDILSLKEKLSQIKSINYEIDNLESLKTIIHAIFVLEKVIKKELQTNFPVVNKYISSEEKIVNYIFMMWLKKIQKTKMKKISEHEAKELFNQLVKNIDEIDKTYDLSMTTLRNSSSNEIVIHNKNGLTNKLGDARETFFKINN